MVVDEDFAQWAGARQHAFVRAAYLVCGDPHLAEDLVQDALAKVAERWERLRGENPDGYARKILYRDSVSSWRRTRHEDRGADLPERSGHPFADAVLDRVALEELLGGLTPGQRAVVVLRFFEDRSVRECAEVLGVSQGTIKSQTHEALRRLRVGAEGLR